MRFIFVTRCAGNKALFFGLISSYISFDNYVGPVEQSKTLFKKRANVVSYDKKWLHQKILSRKNLKDSFFRSVETLAVVAAFMICVHLLPLIFGPL